MRCGYKWVMRCGKDKFRFIEKTAFQVFANTHSKRNLMGITYTGADPGFLESRVHMYKGMGVRFAGIISFFINIP